MDKTERPEAERVSMLRKVITRPAIPDHETGHLGPVDKFLKYGRVPCKLVLNVTMVILLTVEVAIFVPVDNHYHNDSILALSNLFTPNGQVGITPTMDYHFYDTPEIVSFINETWHAWDTVNETATGLYLYELNENGERVMPYISLEVKKNGTYVDIIGESNPDIETEEIRCIMTKNNPLGPFSTAATTSFTSQHPICDGDPLIFEKLDHFTIHFVVDNIRLAGTTNHPTVRRWTLDQRYYMTSRTGVVEFELQYEAGIVGRHIDTASAMSHPYTILPICCLVVALWDLVLRLKQARSEVLRKKKVASIRKHVETVKASGSPISASPPGTFDFSKSLQEADTDLMRPLVEGDGVASVCSSSSSSLSQARRFDVGQEVAEMISNYSDEWWEIEDNRVQWLITAVTTDLLVITSRIVILYINLSSSSIPNSLMVAKSALSGFAVLFAWVVIISHLEHQPRFYLLMKTLRTGTPRALKFVSGCFPILMGYAILGTVMFGGYSDRFATLDGSFVVLFSVMNGDIIDETFESIYFESSLFLKVFSRVYLYTFIALFIYAILNILLAIMEDAYFQVKRQLIVNIREEQLAAE